MILLRPRFEDICRHYGLAIEELYSDHIKATIDGLTVATWELDRDYVKHKIYVRTINNFFISKNYNNEYKIYSNGSKMILCYTTNELEENIINLLEKYKILNIEIRKRNLDKDFY